MSSLMYFRLDGDMNYFGIYVFKDPQLGNALTN